MYADFAYYTQDYGGTLIPEASWPSLSRRAAAQIDRYTFGRLQHGAVVTDGVKNAVCAVAEVLYRQDEEAKTRTPHVKSETVGGQSVSYSDEAEIRKAASREITEAVDLYLPRYDPLRYAGV